MEPCRFCSHDQSKGMLLCLCLVSPASKATSSTARHCFFFKVLFSMATAGFRHALFSAVPHTWTKQSAIQTTSDGWNAPKQRGRRKEHYYHRHQWLLPKACRPCNDLSVTSHLSEAQEKGKVRTTFPPSQPNQQQPVLVFHHKWFIYLFISRKCT